MKDHDNFDLLTSATYSIGLFISLFSSASKTK